MTSAFADYPQTLDDELSFGAATSYKAVAPGAQTVRFAAPGEHATTPVNLAADSVHTIVVLDDSSGLKVDAVTDAVGSRIMPAGAISAGLAGPHHARRRIPRPGW
jgi:hypothetical protein